MFRGAIIASLDDTDILLHNHDNDKYRYSYPLIQYKRIDKRAVVVAVGKGIETIGPLLSAPDFICQIGREKVRMHIDVVCAYDNEISSEETLLHHHLSSWLPLNSRNYAKYQSSESDEERIQFFEHILVGNILSFLKGVGIHIEEQIVTHITDIFDQRPIIYKKVKLMAFDLEFTANIQLPQYIGLGKNASLGYGVLSFA